MKSSAQTKRSGFTIIEVIVALAGILVIVIGALSFQYYCAVDTREADVRAGANRLALLMLEGWRGSAGSEDFDPLIEFGPLAAADGPLESIDPAGEDRYMVVANRTNYFVTLYCNDDVSEPERILRTLSVTVAWSRDYKAEELDEYVRSFTLTTMVEN